MPSEWSSVTVLCPSRRLDASQQATTTAISAFSAARRKPAPIPAGQSIICLLYTSVPPGGAALSPMEGYYLKTTGGDMIVCKDGPCVMRNESGNDGMFDGLRNGDRIEVTYEYVLETYPGKMPVYSCKLLERGSIEDIPEDVLESLSELGWYEENE